MAVISFDQLVVLCKANQGRLLGLDVGTKTVGVALSDQSRLIASPHQTHMRKGWKQDLSYLTALINDNGVVACVLGLPLNMDGSEGSRSAYVRDFGSHLEEAVDVPLVYWDERLSTIAVERVLLEADLSRRRRGEVVDKLAASYILQGVLDRLGNMR